jgi:Protein ENHANCED DISEASE RESISTANCE 2, C-terminal
VRGKDYLTDRKKVPSAEPAFSLLGVELCATAEPDVLHISPYLPVVMHSSATFLTPVHFTLPCLGKNMHLVCVFALEGLPESADSDEPFTAALGQYYAGNGPEDDKRRNRALKMIPMVRAPASSSRSRAATSARCRVDRHIPRAACRLRNDACHAQNS